MTREKTHLDNETREQATTRPWILLALVPLLLLGVAPAASADGEHAYAGSKSCKKCHIKEFKSWETTKMAQAFETLKPGMAVDVKKELGLEPDRDYTKDAECVTCHVTGYGKPGGFVDIETTPELAGVGCESCHGPGGTYIQDGYMTMDNKEYERAELVAVGMVEKVTEEQCTGCHNADVPFPDYSFDFEEKKAEGIHEIYPLKYDHD